MSTNIRFPNITAVTEAEQIVQIKSYLHQLVQQLNWVLSTLEPGKTDTSGSAQTVSAQEYANMVYELKSLLIQSSDMLNSYYEKINAKLEGQYVSQKDFDAYKQTVSEGFAGLKDKYVAQDTFTAYTQDVARDFEGLADVYVKKADYDAYKQTNDTAISGLIQSVEELRAAVEALKPTNETGGD